MPELFQLFDPPGLRKLPLRSAVCTIRHGCRLGPVGFLPAFNRKVRSLGREGLFKDDSAAAGPPDCAAGQLDGDILIIPCAQAAEVFPLSGRAEQ